MKIPNYIKLILCLPLIMLAGCSSGGGDAANPNAPATVTAGVSKLTAIANNTDAVTVQANVKKADGTAVPDGTTVAFSVPAGSATLSAATAVTAGGQASITMTRVPIPAAKNQFITVTCTAGGASDRKDVKFINQPTSVFVSIAMRQAIPNLAALNFKLKNTAGATFDNAAQPIVPSNAAVGSTVAANFDPVLNSTTTSLINAGVNGFNTGTTPLMTATFAVVAGATPTFSFDATPGGLTATDTNGAAITPAVTAADMVVTTQFDTE